MFLFINVTGNKVYEAQVALMQNDLFTDHVLRFYMVIKLSKLK